MSPIQIKPVRSKEDWDRFIDLPWSIYRGDSCWVPPLKLQIRDALDVNKNPFFRHAVMRPLLALRDGQAVGRVVGIIDENHNRFHKEQTAFFGFFESINEGKVTELMLGEVSLWAKGRGMTTLRGPVNLSTNHECGLLVQGFSDPPAVMMTYNPPSYPTLLEGWGMQKAKDLFAYSVTRNSRFAERLMAQSERLKDNSSIIVRSLDTKNFDRDIEILHEIYNDAWEENWGFVPMEPEEFKLMAKEMKAIFDPRLLLIAEVRGVPAAFSLALPDINQAVIKVRDGKLFPTGLLKMLWYLKGPGRRKTINRCRVVTLGIKKEYRHFALGPLFYTEYLKRGPECGYPVGEASWILEDNRAMNRALEMMCGERTKVYRIYDRALG